jgi:hypothetical protein
VNTQLLTCALLASTASLALAQQPSLDLQPSRATPVLPIANPPPAPLVGGSDSCTTPDPISGVGQFQFDDTVATTGPDGQSTINCIFFNAIGIDADVWFVWTAPQTGTAVISTCGLTTIDTKIAVYAAPTGGPYCPTPGGNALACNDDINGVTFPFLPQTRLSFAATAGNSYVFQVGTFPGLTGGVGTFDVSYYTGPSCQYDDGTTEQAISYGTAGTSRAVCWMQREGAIGSTTSLTYVASAWGWTGTSNPLPPGLTANVGVWDDPTDDGDPTDAVLLAQASAPLVGQHTNLLQQIPFASPVTVSGVFFVGAWVTFVNGFPIPIDANGCDGDITPGSWIAINTTGVFDPINLTANTTPPFLENATNGALGFVFLLRADCTAGGPSTTGMPFCPGDGTGTACPCANNSVAGAGEGCLNSLATGGKLRATGTASIGGDTLVLHGTQMANSSCLYFQGTTQASAGAGSVFGDGKRCAGGSVIRLKTKTNVAGASNYPEGADPLISVKGAVTSPGIRTYQSWYRNAAAFCTPSTFNLTNGLEVSWTP